VSIDEHAAGAARHPRRRLRLILVLVVVVLVLGGAGVVLGFQRHFAQKPPAFIAAAGKHRVLTHSLNKDGGHQSLPPNFNVDGKQVRVTLNGVQGSAGRLSASLDLAVGPTADPDHYEFEDFAADARVGQTLSAGGVTLIVVAMWNMPSRANDAVDFTLLSG
jgi:hypothetical protein